MYIGKNKEGDYAVQRKTIMDRVDTALRTKVYEGLAWMWQIFKTSTTLINVFGVSGRGAQPGGQKKGRKIDFTTPGNKTRSEEANLCLLAE